LLDVENELAEKKSKKRRKYRNANSNDKWFSSDSDSDTEGGSKHSTDYSGIYDEVLSDDDEVRLLSFTSLITVLLLCAAPCLPFCLHMSPFLPPAFTAYRRWTAALAALALPFL
jgi:hypothetical protein